MSRRVRVARSGDTSGLVLASVPCLSTRPRGLARRCPRRSLPSFRAARNGFLLTAFEREGSQRKRRGAPRKELITAVLQRDPKDNHNESQTVAAEDLRVPLRCDRASPRSSLRSLWIGELPPSKRVRHGIVTWISAQRLLAVEPAVFEIRRVTHSGRDMNGRLVRTLIASLSLAAGTAEAQNGQAARVDSIFTQFTTGLTPGAAVAVVRNGALVLSKGYGSADLEHRIPITGTSVFDVASVSKQFAGLAVAMLVEQGKVALTDDIRKHIPELPDFGRTITVNHLVHHTSGIRDWPGTLALAGWRMDDVISFDQILTMAYHQRTINFDPGSEYMYSNTGYNLLAELVRRVTGRTFRAWTDEYLFKPLGMTRSHFRDDHTEVFPDRVLGYGRAQDGTFRATSNNLMALGSSSLFTTAEDLAKWLANFDDARVGGDRKSTRLNSSHSQISY